MKRLPEAEVAKHRADDAFYVLRGHMDELLTSAAILEETLGVLRDKCSYSPEQLKEAQSLIEAACYGVFTPGGRLDVVKEDPDDNKILELALLMMDSVVVTGDKHLLKLGRYEHVEIMTVSEFMQRSARRER